MSDKSYVTLEQRVCAVCGKPYDTGALLLDKRLHARFDMHTVTGWGMCPDDARKKEDGFVALVEADEERSRFNAGSRTLSADNAYRTGRVLHIKRDAFARVFESAAPPEGIAFCSSRTIEELLAMANQPEDQHGT